MVGLLDGVRARGAFLLRMKMDPPWSMSIRDEAPLTLICQTHGEAVIVSESGGTTRLAPGDVALARGTEHYLFADDPATKPMVVINPGQRCTTLSGDDLRFEMSLGVRTWGNSCNRPDDVADLRVRRPQRSQRATAGCASDGAGAARRRLEQPPRRPARRRGRTDGPGQEAYLDRLLDVLLIAVLRAWFDRGENAPTWWHAERDPVVGRALKLIYNNPAHPWTVANLAAAVGNSRAVFARRFTDQVGEPPIAFLTTWRLALAADMLRSGRTTIAAIARQVGYGTPFALSSAFKRAYGVSPNVYRETAAASDQPDSSAL